VPRSPTWKHLHCFDPLIALNYPADRKATVTHLGTERRGRRGRRGRWLFREPSPHWLLPRPPSVAIVEKTAGLCGQQPEARRFPLRHRPPERFAVRDFEQLAPEEPRARRSRPSYRRVNPPSTGGAPTPCRREGNGAWQDCKYPFVTHDPFPSVPETSASAAASRIAETCRVLAATSLWTGCAGILDAVSSGCWTAALST